MSRYRDRARAAVGRELAGPVVGLVDLSCLERARLSMDLGGLSLSRLRWVSSLLPTAEVHREGAIPGTGNATNPEARLVHDARCT